MQIFVEIVSEKTITIDVKSIDRIGILMSKIEKIEGIPQDQQHIYFEGKYLILNALFILLIKDQKLNRRLKFYNYSIQNNSTLLLYGKFFVFLY